MEYKLQTCTIARAFGQFVRQESSDLCYTFILRILPIVIRAIINIFPTRRSATTPARFN